MPTLVIYTLNTDPLGATDVTVLSEFVVDITDDDPLLEGVDTAGPQLDPNDFPPGLQLSNNGFQTFEAYTGTLNGDPVAFTLLQFSSPVFIVATQGTFNVGDTITGTNNTIVPASSSPYTDLPDFVCFAAGSLVETPSGPQAVETMQIGDLVVTRTGQMKPIKWIGARHLSARDLYENPHLRPIEIAPGAFGPAIPSQTVRLSPQHRVALTAGASAIALDASEVLVAARHLVGRPGVSVDILGRDVTYVHFLLEDHDLVCVSDLWSETLFLGETVVCGLSDAARVEIEELFPRMAQPMTASSRTCLPVLGKREARVAMADLTAFVPQPTKEADAA